MNFGKHGVLVRISGDEFFEGGYWSFSDAVEAMMDKWMRLSGLERAALRRRDYRNALGVDYMVAVGDYDEETGEAWETMTLAEALKAMEEEEEE